MQLTHYNSKFKKKTFPITLISDNVTNALNIGSLFRIADAFGIEQLIFCGEDIRLGKRMKRTSRATEQQVKYSIKKDIKKVINDLKSKFYKIIALEITNNSMALHHHNFSSDYPIAIIVGNENYGVSELVLNQCDTIIHVNMFGHNSSMNVAQVSGIVLYEITKQLS